MIILGIILGGDRIYFTGIGILYTLGGILVVVGVILWILGAVGRRWLAAGSGFNAAVGASAPQPGTGATT